MDWLKKNLFFIGWGALALVLTAVAIYFWSSEKDRDTQLETEVTNQRAEMERLIRSNPQPNPTNIARAKAEVERVQQFVGDTKKLITAPVVQRTDNAGFRKQLEESLAQLLRGAADARVNVVSNYNFSFEVQRRAVNFYPGSLEPLLARLDEVKYLCNVLFQAKVHSLDGVRRISVAVDDNGTAADILLQQVPRTNAVTGAVAYPYELSFSGFSRELGQVMDSLLKAPPFVIIRNVTVEPVALAGAAAAAALNNPGASPDAAPAAPVTPDDGAPKPPSGFVAPGRPGARGGPVGPVTLLDQRLLRITLALDIINPGAVAATPK